MRVVRVLSVFGTRPEAVKMLPLVKCIDSLDVFEGRVCVTGQHREMLDQVLKVFGVCADYDLDLMCPGQSLSSVVAGVLVCLEKVFAVDCPDLVLVHGDTVSGVGAALAAFYRGVPVGHVEAGLRSFNRCSLFPEEINRCLVARLASLHFCPTALNVRNLLREGVVEHVYWTGNTVIDAFATTLRENYVFKNEVLRGVDFVGCRVVLVTVHRRENWVFLRQICLAVLRVVGDFSDVLVVFHVHKDPLVSCVVYELLAGHSRVCLVGSLDVVDMPNLLRCCFLVLTDSGGLQEEASALGKPVLVLRDVTERSEVVDLGVVRVVGVDSEKNC